MRAAPIISLILSVVIGIVAVVFGRSWIDSEAEASRQPTSAEVVVQEVETEMILVAADLIERGDHLEESSVTLVEWPKELLPEDALTNADEILSDDGAYPFANGLIAAGEPILKAKVALRQPRDTLATVIEPGFRAVSIEVDDATGVAGFILPDHRVDVNLSREITNSDGSAGYRPETLMQDIRVLAVDQNFAPDLEGTSLARTVTLQVSPSQARIIRGAMDQGNLGLALRPKNEPSLAVVPVVRRARRPAPAPRPSFASVRVIEGDEEQTVSAPVARSKAN